jgi:hypothetical protein
VSVAAFIQTHPSRAGMVPALLDALAPLPATVVVDPEPDGTPSPWRSHRAALEKVEHMDDDVTHVLLLEDDAQVCGDFAEGVSRLVEARRNDVFTLYVGFHDVAFAARASGWDRAQFESWLDDNEARNTLSLVPIAPLCVPVVALSLPIKLARRYATWARLNPPPLGRASTNAAFTKFTRSEQLEVLAPIPCLVDHPDETWSLVNERPGWGRRAYRFLGSRSPAGWNVSDPLRPEAPVSLLPWPEHNRFAAYMQGAADRPNDYLVAA